MEKEKRKEEVLDEKLLREGFGDDTCLTTNYRPKSNLADHCPNDLSCTIKSPRTPRQNKNQAMDLWPPLIDKTSSKSTEGLPRLIKQLSNDSASKQSKNSISFTQKSRDSIQEISKEIDSGMNFTKEKRKSSSSNGGDSSVGSQQVSGGKISQFLIKMKEKIEKSAMESSCDWPPHPSLIMQYSLQTKRSYNPRTAERKEAYQRKSNKGSTKSSERSECSHDTPESIKRRSFEKDRLSFEKTRFENRFETDIIREQTENDIKSEFRGKANSLENPKIRASDCRRKVSESVLKSEQRGSTPKMRSCRSVERELNEPRTTTNRKKCISESEKAVFMRPNSIISEIFKIDSPCSSKTCTPRTGRKTLDTLVEHSCELSRKQIKVNFTCPSPKLSTSSCSSSSLLRSVPRRKYLAVQEDVPSCITEKSEASQRSERTDTNTSQNPVFEKESVSPGPPSQKAAKEKIQTKNPNSNSQYSSYPSFTTILIKSSNSGMPEIKFDETGFTWEIYGADLDPKELGNAIQEHIQKLIEKKNSSVNSKGSESGTSQRNIPLRKKMSAPAVFSDVKVPFRKIVTNTEENLVSLDSKECELENENIPGSVENFSTRRLGRFGCGIFTCFR